MEDGLKKTSPIEAIRCFYLSRHASRIGETDAARRWNDKALQWLGHTRPMYVAHFGRVAESPQLPSPLGRGAGGEGS